MLFFTATAQGEAIPPARLIVHFLDVGYGDATVLRLPEGGVILVDGGGPDQASRIAAALRKLGIQHLDYLVITHFHKDHAGGLGLVLEEFVPPEAPILLPLLPKRVEPEVEAVLAEVERRPYRIVGRGEWIPVSSSVRLEVLHPRRLTGDPNEDSLVLKVIHGRITLLLAADVMLTGQRELFLEYGSRLKSDLIKIPHHAGEAQEAFIQAVSPQDAILTIGPNPYGSPNPKVLEMYRKAGSLIHRTDEKGAITVTSDGRSFQISTERSP